MSKLYEKYRDLLKSGKLSEREISALRSVLAGARGSLTDDELTQLKSDFYTYKPAKGYKLTAQQNVKGKNFLKQWCYCINGETRKQAKERLGLRELYAVNNADYFTLTELYSYNFSKNTLPVYTLWTKDGHGFDYYYNGNVNVIG